MASFEPFVSSDPFAMRTFNSKLGGAFGKVDEAINKAGLKLTKVFQGTVATGTTKTPFTINIPSDAKIILVTIGTTYVDSGCSGPFSNTAEVVVKSSSENGNIIYDITHTFYVHNDGIISGKYLQIGYDISTGNLTQITGWKTAQVNNVNVYYLK